MEARALTTRLRAFAARGEQLLVVPPLVFTAVVYFRLTDNYFYVDDFLNLYQIANLTWLEYLFTPFANHVQPTRNAAFYLCFLFFGTHAELYYGLAFLTHLLNVALLFRVVVLLSGSARLACFGATLWGICPQHAATLGWYSVYGQVLVGTALLVILWQALRVATRGGPVSRRRTWLWYALALMAATSFGNGLGVAVALPLALWLMLPSSHRAVTGQRPLISLVLVVPTLYAVILWASQRWMGQQPSGQDPLAVLSRLEDVLLYLVSLLAFGLSTLVRGAFRAPLPATDYYGMLACLVIALIAAARVAAPATQRRITAVGVLVLACYGIIAVGRATWISDQMPTRFLIYLMQPHYHYVGQLLLTLLLCLALQWLAARLPAKIGTTALIAWYGTAMVTQAYWPLAIDHHVGERRATERVTTAMRAAIDRQLPGKAVYLDNKPFRPALFQPDLFPGWAGVFTIFFPHNVVDGRPVYFVDERPAVARAALRGQRTRTLIVPSRPTLDPMSAAAPPPAR